MNDVQDVVRTMARQAIRRIEDLRQRRERHGDAEQVPLSEFTAEFVHNTWAKVALAAGIGLIAGLLMRRIVKRIG